MNSKFGIKGLLGFGCMRLPMIDKEVDFELFSKMVDEYIDAGFNYFDTAHGYLGGKSETALKKCLTSRYPRESYMLTDKLSHNYFEKNEDIRPFFESQLEACGVEYFDFYLMHAQQKNIYEKYKRCRAYETALELRNEGKIKHFGISFHDKADVLREILTDYPEIEAVQIQFNYADYEDAAVQSRKCYEVCREFGKAVIVMEPVKGGNLVKLPEEAGAFLDSLGGGSRASYAVRFAAGFDGVISVLSGMGDLEMIKDNISYMRDFKPLDDHEKNAVAAVCRKLSEKNLINCTACAYCTERCPNGIKIPEAFACLNARRTFAGWNPEYYYNDVHTRSGGKASECIGCGLCEETCPQHLEIRKLLNEVVSEFETKN